MRRNCRNWEKEKRRKGEMEKPEEKGKEKEAEKDAEKVRK